MTTHEFARAVDEPVAVILDKHRIGLFRAAISHPTGGRGRATYYSREQVEHYNALKETAVDPITAIRVYSAEEAKLGFAALRAGKSLQDLVIDLTIHPSRARAIADDFASLGGGLYLSQSEVNSILAMELPGPTKLEKGADILELLKAVGSESACSCARGERSLCILCVNDRIRKAVVAASQKQTETAPDPQENADVFSPRRAG